MDDIPQSDDALDPGDLVRVTFDPPCQDGDHRPIRSRCSSGVSSSLDMQ